VALAHPKRKKKAMLDAIIFFMGYLLNSLITNQNKRVSLSGD